MKSFDIKVTGGGTKREIVNALHQLIESINALDSDELNSKTFEIIRIYQNNSLYLSNTNQ